MMAEEMACAPPAPSHIAKTRLALRRSRDPAHRKKRGLELHACKAPGMSVATSPPESPGSRDQD